MCFPTPPALHFVNKGNLQFTDRHIQLKVVQKIVDLKLETATLRTGIAKMGLVCSKLPEGCPPLLKKLERNSQLLSSKVNNLAPQTRHKRVAPLLILAYFIVSTLLVGSVVTTVSLMFSVASITQNLAELETRQSTLYHVMQQQTYLLEKNADVTDGLLKGQENSKSRWNETVSTLNDVIVRLEMSELVMKSNIIIDELTDILDFVRTQRNAETATARLLARANLTDLLATAERQSNFSLPPGIVPEEWLILTNVAITENELHFTFAFPIVSPLLFSLYSIVPVPIQSGIAMTWFEPLASQAAISPRNNIRVVDPARCQLMANRTLCVPSPVELDAVRSKCIAAAWDSKPLVEDCPSRTTTAVNVVTPLGPDTWAFSLTEPLLLGSELAQGSGVYTPNRLSINESLVISETLQIVSPAADFNIKMLPYAPPPSEDLKDAVRDLHRKVKLLNDVELAPVSHHTAWGISGAVIGISLIIAVVVLVIWLKRRSPLDVGYFQRTFGPK